MKENKVTREGPGQRERENMLREREYRKRGQGERDREEAEETEKDRKRKYHSQTKPVLTHLLMEVMSCFPLSQSTSCHSPLWQEEREGRREVRH